jgi:Phosphotransferase enzyme family
VLKLLGEQSAFDVPDVVAASPDPACLATRIVGSGVPLSYGLVRGSIPKRVAALGAELARFLANLHAPQILARARERLDDPLRIPEPGLQATTDELRLRFTPMIQPRQRALVRRWCDWVDEQLAAPATIVFVHGDFHPYNQLWDAQELRLLLVADFETSGIAEPEYDFRAIPSFGLGIDLLTSTIDEYVALTGRRLWSAWAAGFWCFQTSRQSRSRPGSPVLQRGVRSRPAPRPDRRPERGAVADVQRYVGLRPPEIQTRCSRGSHRPNRCRALAARRRALLLQTEIA